MDVSLDPGPGCELGGIIGWRTKQGRRGLGGEKRVVHLGLGDVIKGLEVLLLNECKA